MPRHKCVVGIFLHREYENIKHNKINCDDNNIINDKTNGKYCNGITKTVLSSLNYIPNNIPKIIIERNNIKRASTSNTF